jgi:hypothetical protein
MSDLTDGPRVAFAAGTTDEPLPIGDNVLQTITVTAPAPGRVVVNASGTFWFMNNTVAESVMCSITTGPAIDTQRYFEAAEVAVGAMSSVPFASTRGFDVPSGTHTFNLVCRQMTGTVHVNKASLTGMFVALPAS